VAATAETNPDEHLAWEARRSRPAAAAAIAAGTLLLAGPVLLVLAVQRGLPTVGLVQALTPALSGRAVPAQDPRTPVILHLHSHAAGLLAYAVINLLGLIALAIVLTYMFRAARARRPGLPQPLLALVIVGPLLIGLVALATEIATLQRASTFASGTDHSHAAVQHVLDLSRSVGLGAFGTLGQLMTAAAFVIVSLNAMRVGLLTRFMGVLGVICGALYAFPILPIPIIQSFWLVALAPLILHRWPQGQPPAWITGRAEPWPSGQQVREQAAAERNRAEAQAIKAAPAASDAAEPVRPAQPGSNRRKRKRR
jgi:hypothetical protein